MEKNDSWVDDRLAKLNPEEEWRPHITLGLARFEGRKAQRRFTAPRTLSVVAIAAICLLTFPQPRAFAQRVLTPCVEACESLVLSQRDIHDPLHHLIWTFHSWMGLTAPNFKATDAKGESFQLSDYAGKVILVNFWATWCKPCKEEIPWFVEFQKAYEKQGFVVIGVSMDEGGWKAVRPVMEAQKINYRVALGNEEIAKLYGGLESLPETVLIEPMGRIVKKHVGITGKSQYEREITALIDATK